VLTANRAKVMVAPVDDQALGAAAWRAQQAAQQATLHAAAPPRAAHETAPAAKLPLGGHPLPAARAATAASSGGEEASSGSDGCPCYFEAAHKCTVRCGPSPDADSLAELDKGRVVKAVAMGGANRVSERTGELHCPLWSASPHLGRVASVLLYAFVGLCFFDFFYYRERMLQLLLFFVCSICRSGCASRKCPRWHRQSR
jgi:hypothetical protein